MFWALCVCVSVCVYKIVQAHCTAEAFMPVKCHVMSFLLPFRSLYALRTAGAWCVCVPILNWTHRWIPHCLWKHKFILNPFCFMLLEIFSRLIEWCMARNKCTHTYTRIRRTLACTRRHSSECSARVQRPDSELCRYGRIRRTSVGRRAINYVVPYSKLHAYVYRHVYFIFHNNDGDGRWQPYVIRAFKCLLLMRAVYASCYCGSMVCVSVTW